MPCPFCKNPETNKRIKTTKLGYKTFYCPNCKFTYNERTGTPFNDLHFPTDIILLVVRWRLRYKLSLRDVAEMFIERGFEFTYEAVRDWEERFTLLLTEKLRARRKGKAGTSWYVDETYVKVKGKWVYLYRAIDRKGNLVDSRLSKTRDLEAAKEFFKRAVKIVDHKPERVTTDGHDSCPKALRKVIGKKVMHRTNHYLNNRIEQDHRAIKQRYYPTRGFKSFESASRFCSGFDELRNFFNSGPKLGSAVLRRLQHHARIEVYTSLMKAA